VKPNTAATGTDSRRNIIEPELDELARLLVSLKREHDEVRVAAGTSPLDPLSLLAILFPRAGPVPPDILWGIAVASRSAGEVCVVDPRQVVGATGLARWRRLERDDHDAQKMVIGALNRRAAASERICDALFVKLPETNLYFAAEGKNRVWTARTCGMELVANVVELCSNGGSDSLADPPCPSEPKAHSGSPSQLTHLGDVAQLIWKATEDRRADAVPVRASRSTQLTHRWDSHDSGKIDGASAVEVVDVRM